MKFEQDISVRVFGKFIDLPRPSTCEGRVAQKFATVETVAVSASHSKPQCTVRFRDSTDAPATTFVYEGDFVPALYENIMKALGEVRE